jgi:hypothetical protein
MARPPLTLQQRRLSSHRREESGRSGTRERNPAGRNRAGSYAPSYGERGPIALYLFLTPRSSVDEDDADARPTSLHLSEPRSRFIDADAALVS